MTSSTFLPNASSVVSQEHEVSITCECCWSSQLLGFVDTHLSFLFAMWLQALCLVISSLEPQGESSFGENCSCQVYRKLSKQSATSFSVALLFPASQRTFTHHCDVTAVNAELLELLFSRLNVSRPGSILDLLAPFCCSSLSSV